MIRIFFFLDLSGAHRLILIDNRLLSRIFTNSGRGSNHTSDGPGSQLIPIRASSCAIELQERELESQISSDYPMAHEVNQNQNRPDFVLPRLEDLLLLFAAENRSVFSLLRHSKRRSITLRRNKLQSYFSISMDLSKFYRT